MFIFIPIWFYHVLENYLLKCCFPLVYLHFHNFRVSHGNGSRVHNLCVAVYGLEQPLRVRVLWFTANLWPLTASAHGALFAFSFCHSENTCKQLNHELLSTVLLIYNLYTIKFTHLQYIYNSMKFITFTELYNHHYDKLGNIFITPKRNFIWIISHFPFTNNSPNPWQQLIYFLSPLICLFQVFHINRIM